MIGSLKGTFDKLIMMKRMMNRYQFEANQEDLTNNFSAKQKRLK